MFLGTLVLLGVGFGLCQAFVFGTTAWCIQQGEPKGYTLLLLLTPLWAIANVAWLWLWFRGVGVTNPIAVRLIQSLASSVVTVLILWIWLGRLHAYHILALALYACGAVLASLAPR